MSRYYIFNKDGTIKYVFDGMFSIELPNNPQAPTLRDLGLSLVHPFYNEEERFKVQLETWMGYSDLVKRAIYINVVDDCSDPPVLAWLPNKIVKRLDINISIQRIGAPDVKWNTPAALNLGIHTAKTDWVLFMDSDCLMEEPMLAMLLTKLSPEKETAYFFMRKRITNDPVKAQVIRPLTCCILVNKELWNNVGGFDEDFVGAKSGGYGMFDCDFVWRLGNNRCVVRDVIVTEYLELGKNIQEKSGVQEDHIKINKRLFRAKQMGKVPPNLDRLAFEWKTKLDHERW